MPGSLNSYQIVQFTATESLSFSFLYNGRGFDLPGMLMPGLVLSLVGHLRHEFYFEVASYSVSIFLEGG